MILIAFRPRGFVLLSLNLAAIATLAAQNPPSRDPRNEAVVLSPFEVRSTSDSGYTVTDSNSALKIAVDTKDLPFSLSVLSADLIRDFAAMNEIEALRLNAGVNATENFIAKSQNRPFIRGTSSVRVYADGLFMNSLQTPGIAIDRVEVLKGTSGSLFGLGEPGGTLNYVFKPALAKARGSVTAGIGSWGERFSDVDIGGPVSSDSKLTSRIALRYQSGDAYTEYTGFETRELYARLRYAFRPDTTLQLTLAHSDRHTDAPAYMRWDGFAGRRNPNNEANQSARFQTLGTDPVSSGLLNRRSNTNTPQSFADVVTTAFSADFGHKFSSRWWLRASARRTHMDRDSMITSKFVTTPVLEAGSTLAPSATTGQPVTTPTIIGDLLASPDGQLGLDNLASDSVHLNLLGHFDFRAGSWKTVLGSDYNQEVFYGDRWRSSWWWTANAAQRAAQLPAAQRIQAVVANVLKPSAGWNLTQATPPRSTFTVPDGNFTNTTQGMGYYWVNHVKLFDDRLIFTGSGRRDEPEAINKQFFQVSRTGTTVGQANQFKSTYSVGAVYNLTKQFSFYANDGTTFRPQVTLLLDRNQNRFLAEPIEGGGGDVGFRLDLPKQRLRLSAGLFRVRQSNLVVNVSEFQPATGTTLTWQEQSGENQVKGYEFEVSANLGSALSLNLSYAHLDSSVKSNKSLPLTVGQELAQTPDNSAVLLVRYSIGNGFSLGGSGTVVRDDRIFISAPNNNPLARTYVSNYAFGDVFATYSRRLRGSYSLRTQLNVYNVTDKLYASEFGLSKPIGYRFSTSLSW